MTGDIYRYYAMLASNTLGEVAAAAIASDLSASQRALVAVRSIPRGTALDKPRAKEVGLPFGISLRYIQSAARLAWRAPADLLREVESGRLSIDQAERRLRVPPVNPPCARADEGLEPPHRRSPPGVAADRHLFTRMQAVNAIADALDGLGYVLNQTDELHPGIPAEQAAAALARINGSTKYLARLKTLLKERVDDNA